MKNASGSMEGLPENPLILLSSLLPARLVDARGRVIVRPVAYDPP